MTDSIQYGLDLEQLLSSRQGSIDLLPIRQELEGKAIVITGAGGSIGSELSQTILECRPRLLILLELCEHALYRVTMRLAQASASLPHPPDVLPVLGSIGDAHLLDYQFTRYKPDIIYHAAAFKHVPLMEQNCFAVVANNALGTYTLAMSALRHEVGKLILVSTDKAVNPKSMMGASKRVAERVLLSLNSSLTHMTSIRLGNVLGSQGSVAPLFQKQIARGGPVTVTDPGVSRYVLTLHEAVRRIMQGASLDRPGCILVPEMGLPIKIVDLAKGMIERAKVAGIQITYTGLRPGDKMVEQLMTDEERASAAMEGAFSVIRGPSLSITELTSSMIELEHAIQSYDETKLMAAVHKLVPEYNHCLEAVR